jgi:hypothetical protein
MKKTTWFIAGFFVLAILGAVVYSVQNSWRSFFGVALANPDYICVKPVTQYCQVTGDTWDPALWTQTSTGYVRTLTSRSDSTVVDNSGWDKETHSRTRQGRYVTSVYYLNRRTACEPWYTKYGTAGNTGGAGGRNGMTDQVYSYGWTCTLVEVDTVPPVSDPVVTPN